MMKWWGLLGFDFLAAANAALVFKYFDRPTAGFLAGTVFFILGLLAFFLVVKFARSMRTLSVLLAAVFLFGLSGPLFVARLLTPFGQSVDRVFGLPLEPFHAGSTLGFWSLVAITILQVWGTRAQKQ